MASAEQGVVAGFGTTHQAEDAIRALREADLGKVEVYSPVPHDFNEAMGDGDSPIWAVALTGGILGCTTGYTLSTWCGWVYPLIVGGKDFNTPIPYGHRLRADHPVHRDLHRPRCLPDGWAGPVHDTEVVSTALLLRPVRGVCLLWGDAQAKAEELMRAAGAQDVERL